LVWILLKQDNQPRPNHTTCWYSCHDYFHNGESCARSLYWEDAYTQGSASLSCPPIKKIKT
jgi:hypothetical protein